MTNLGAKKYNITKRIIWHKLWIIICFHILPLIIDSFLFVGSRCKSSSYGGSVAKAKEPKESIIRLTQSIWIGVNGVSFPTQAHINTSIQAQKLTDNWNCKNLRILSYIFLPYIIAVTIELKLLSIITISEASLAISVPANIANPTSDFDKAGASFVPSPVTATTFFKDFNPRTRAYLCKGWDLAITLNFSVIFWKFWISLIISFLTFFLGSPVFLAICSASDSVFGHLHKLVSFWHTSHINPPTEL